MTRIPAAKAAVAAAIAAVLVLAASADAHVTPNVQLVKRGTFIRNALPGASRFFETHLDLGKSDLAAVRAAAGWTPSSDDTKVYAGRTADGSLVGRAVFVWVPSMHGPVSVGVAFDANERILTAAVTDVGSEPLAWVKPLIEAGGMDGFAGLGPDSTADPAGLAPEVTGSMSRYYAEVIAGGVRRAQLVEHAVSMAH